MGRGVWCLWEPDLRGVHAEGSEEAHAALHLLGVEVLREGTFKKRECTWTDNRERMRACSDHRHTKKIR